MAWWWPLERPKHVANSDLLFNIIYNLSVVFDWFFFGILLLQHTTGWAILRKWKYYQPKSYRIFKNNPDHEFINSYVTFITLTAVFLYPLPFLVQLATEKGPSQRDASQARYVKLDAEVRSCNHCCGGKAISVRQLECVFVALGIKHAMPYCHLWPASVYNIYSHYLITGTIFEKKKCQIRNVCFEFLYNFWL
jgi:hypothetical protein